MGWIGLSIGPWPAEADRAMSLEQIHLTPITLSSFRSAENNGISIC